MTSPSLALVLIGLAAWAGSTAARAAETVTACFDDQDRSGYAHLDARGQWTGAAVEAVRALGRRAGVQLVLQPLPWARCLNQAKTNGPDAVDFAFYGSANPQRLEDYEFLGPLHHISGGVWFVRARADLPHELPSYEVMGQYRLCGLSGFNYAWLQQVGISRIDAGAHNFKAAVVKLSRQRCDYLLGTAELRTSAERYGIGSDEMASLAFTPYPGATPVGQFMLFNRRLPQHRAVFEGFSAAFNELSQQGVIAQIYKSYGLAP